MKGLVSTIYVRPQEVFHLVNFDYDSATDRVVSMTSKTFAFAPRGTFTDAKATYHTPESPAGTVLPITVLGSGKLQVTIPALHVYGILALGENAADLAIVKTSSGSLVRLGGELTYGITVSNNGPEAATNVALTDTLPADVALVSLEPAASCSETGGTVTCTLSSLASGASFTATVVVSTTEAGTVTNTATVASDIPDNNAANNSASVTTTVTTLDLVPGLTPWAIFVLAALLALVLLRRQRAKIGESA